MPVPKAAPADVAATHEASKEIVRLRSVFKEYATRTAGNVAALEDIDLDIKESQFVTIVGPSGCGKSTVLKLVGGIIAPSSGGCFSAASRLAAAIARNRHGVPEVHPAAVANGVRQRPVPD